MSNHPNRRAGNPARNPTAAEVRAARKATDRREIMARIIIKTRTEGEFTFWCPTGGGYVRLETEGRPGTLGQQICEGGGLMGSTLEATEATLGDVARKWLRQRRARMNRGA